MQTPKRDLAICLEQTLGHRTHGQNLERALTGRSVQADVFRVARGGGRKLSPWAVEGSRSAFRQIRGSRREYRVTFFHTQTIGLLARRATPVNGKYVISVDATPAQMDSLGRWYSHRRGPWPLERAKLGWYRRVLGGATSVVAWSDWAKSSLVEDYHVDPERVVVAHPGAPAELFGIERSQRHEGQGPVRILFVGGDFDRKGGPALLKAVDALEGRAMLTMMTEAEIPSRPHVTVLRGVRPGTEDFLKAFTEADIFCLPTLGDCTPVVLGEAMAAGLPVVTTDVGSNRETVPADCGLVITPGDTPALHTALAGLCDNANLRNDMGRAARHHARSKLSAGDNAGRIIDHLVELAR